MIMTQLKCLVICNKPFPVENYLQHIQEISLKPNFPLQISILIECSITALIPKSSLQSDGNVIHMYYTKCAYHTLEVWLNSNPHPAVMKSPVFKVSRRLNEKSETFTSAW
jgi:hypothetical protein